MVMRFLVHFGLFIFLTVLTQVGGVAYLATLAFKRFLSIQGPMRPVALTALFLVFYAGLSVAAVFVAPKFGRVALPCGNSESASLRVHSPIYCALNRHYVTPELREIAYALATHMDKKFPGTVTLALDANFPFIEGFPLIPHLSHDDGLKLDFAFYYRSEKDGYIRGATRSPVGYWAFEEPATDKDSPCYGRSDFLSLRWDMPWFRVFHKNLELDEERTKAALSWLATEGSADGVSKIFVEPHLARRLNVSDETIRFQGCRAARHDDHIHMQIHPR